jgi:hypothetical protein
LLQDADVAIGNYVCNEVRQSVVDFGPVPLNWESYSMTFYTSPPINYSTWY